MKLNIDVRTKGDITVEEAIVDELTLPVIASGTETESPKFENHTKARNRVTIFMSKQMALTRT